MLAAIGLGANLESVWGSRENALREAIKRLGSLGVVRSVSAFYETEPVGYLDQPNFLNAALLLETELGARELMGGLLATEQAMGRDRIRQAAKGPRIIDLDLLLLGNQVTQDPVATVPHPALRDRLFVLKPLAEIASDMVDPITGSTIQELLKNIEI